MANSSTAPQVSEVSFRFDVPKITTLNEVLSPDFTIYGVPWNLKINQLNRGTEKWIAIFLNCATKDESPNWSYVASASVKLLPFDGHPDVTEGHNGPYIFDKSNKSVGDWMIRWCDLLDNTKHYVKNDMIRLKVKIHVVDPNEVNKSELTFENINRSCEEGCSTKYRLTISNVKNLNAVRSPMFMLRNTQWYFSMYKDHLNHLGYGLAFKDVTKVSSCEVKISVKINSTNKAKERKETWKINDGSRSFKINSVASLDELTKPENGFMQNNSIAIELQLNLDNLKDEVRTNCSKRKITTASTNAKLFKLECAICLGCFGDQDVSFTPCGHMFCSKCIEDSVKLHKRCPSCNGPVELVELKRAHLPCA